MDYVAMQLRRRTFFTGMYRCAQVNRRNCQAVVLRPGTPAVAKFLLDLGYNTGEFGKNHLGDGAADARLPEYWGYLYHLDAMQQVSFPDINRAQPGRHRAAVPQRPRFHPGAVDRTTTCLTPPPVLVQSSPLESEVQRRGPRSGSGRRLRI
jgi:arylsulfatase